MRENIIEYLSKCNLVELSYIVSAAISKRSDAIVKEEREDYGYQQKILLCEVSRERFADELWGPWNICLIAPEDKNQYNQEWEVANGEPFLQGGNCSSCDVTLISHAKKSTCPLCGKYVPLT